MSTNDVPADEEQKTIIEKLAKFVAKNGPEFERMTREKQEGNPKFDFLRPGGQYNGFYTRILNEEKSACPEQNISDFNAVPMSNVAKPWGPPSGPIDFNWQNPAWRPQNPNFYARPPPGFPPQGVIGEPNDVMPCNMPPFISNIPTVPEKESNKEEKAEEIQYSLEEVKQSEENLMLQKTSFDEAEKKEKAETLKTLKNEYVFKKAKELNVSISSMNEVIDPLIDSCTKDHIAKGKAWIIDVMSKSEALTELMGDYLIYRVCADVAKFSHKLHIVYLVNDLLHSMKKRGSSHYLQNTVNRIVVPIFCQAAKSANSDEKVKLVRVWELWGKNGYLPSDVMDRMKMEEVTNSVEQFELSEKDKFKAELDEISKRFESEYDNLKKQHEEFEQYVKNQIEAAEKAKKLSEQKTVPPPNWNSQAPPPGFFPQGFPPGNFAPPCPSMPYTTYPSDNYETYEPWRGNITSDEFNDNFYEKPPYNCGGPPIDQMPPRETVHITDYGCEDYRTGSYMDSYESKEDRDPSSSRGPSPNSTEIIPSDKYWQLPASLMHPLIKLKDFDFKPLKPEKLRLPRPHQPSNQLMNALDAFYAPPSHDRPRDAEGWERLALLDFCKEKENAKSQLELKTKRSSHKGSSSRLRRNSGGSFADSDDEEDIFDKAFIRQVPPSNRPPPPLSMSYICAYPAKALGQPLHTGPDANKFYNDVAFQPSGLLMNKGVILPNKTPGVIPPSNFSQPPPNLPEDLSVPPPGLNVPPPAINSNSRPNSNLMPRGGFKRPSFNSDSENSSDSSSRSRSRTRSRSRSNSRSRSRRRDSRSYSRSRSSSRSRSKSPTYSKRSSRRDKRRRRRSRSPRKHSRQDRRLRNDSSLRSDRDYPPREYYERGRDMRDSRDHRDSRDLRDSRDDRGMRNKVDRLEPEEMPWEDLYYRPQYPLPRSQGSGYGQYPPHYNQRPMMPPYSRSHNTSGNQYNEIDEQWNSGSHGHRYSIPNSSFYPGPYRGPPGPYNAGPGMMGPPPRMPMHLSNYGRMPPMMPPGHGGSSK